MLRENLQALGPYAYARGPGAEPNPPVASSERLPVRSPTRILVYLHSHEPGGVERVALRLSKAWQGDGADVTVLLGRTDGATQNEAPDLTYVHYRSGPVSTVRFETAWMILCLARQVLAARPDVIFCAGNSYTVVAVALRLLLGRRCPPIVAKVSNSPHRKDLLPPFRFAYRQWLRLQGPLIARWVSMADAMRPEIAHAMRVPLREIEVVDDPAICELEHENLAAARDSFQRTSECGRLFMAAGRLVRQKRFDLLIRAFARGGGSQDRLVILGEGPLRRRLEALVARHELADRVSFPGHAARLKTWLARADALVLCSDYEGVPAVVIEAMAAGVPVIATNSSAALPELLGHGRFGKLVRRRDEAQLAQTIADPRSLLTDVAGARRHARQFVVERTAPVYLKVMRPWRRKRTLRNNLRMGAKTRPAIRLAAAVQVACIWSGSVPGAIAGPARPQRT